MLLSASDPLLAARTPHARGVRRRDATSSTSAYVDPERNPAEFVAIQQKYGILAGKADDGRVVTDAGS